MDKLDALWRRDYAIFALEHIAKQLNVKARRSGLDAMIDAALKPTEYGKQLAILRNKAIERNLREIIKCQKALGEDTEPHREALKKFLAMK